MDNTPTADQKIPGYSPGWLEVTPPCSSGEVRWCVIYNPSETLLLASLVAQMVKRLPAMWETWVRSLGQEDPLVKKVATHSSTLACKIP